MTSVAQLIKQGFSKAFDKYLYDELVIGKLAHHEAKTIAKKGDEVDIKMPAMVTLFDYDGGDLPTAEKVDTSFVKVKIDRGAGVHFTMSQIEEDFIKNSKSDVDQAALIREYTSDAVKQFAAKVDTAYGNLFTRAGHYLDDNGSAIELTAQTAKDILAYMQAKFQRGDGKGHTNWIDGQMLAIVPPEYQFYLGKLEDLKYTESGKKEQRKGYIGTLCGWDILVSNNIASPSSNVYYPLFGLASKTLAGGMSNDLNMQDYVPEKNFDRTYKGYGLFGVGAPRADFLGTVKISAPLTLTTT